MCLLILAAGCASTGGKHVAREEIPQMLEQQAQAWNAGDIDAFMAPYWHSPDLTFSSAGQVTRGWQATLDRYRRRYPTREAMGRLTFSDIEVTQPGPNVALVLGRWRLERTEPIGGGFTLVLRKYAGNWVIVHDHTSVDPP
jgi:beta-aspartyl-peptidase (threonine type)